MLGSAAGSGLASSVVVWGAGGTSLTGTRFLDRWALVSDQPDGSSVVDLMDLEARAAAVVFRVDAPNVSTAHPTLSGGLHVLERDGTLLTYDENGTLVADMETGSPDVGIITLDPATGILALAGADGIVVLVDPSTGELKELPRVDLAANLGFAKGGELRFAVVV